MIASMRKPAISADLQATMKRVMLMENYELGKASLTANKAKPCCNNRRKRVESTRDLRLANQIKR